jgi:hypothetical protein
MKKLVVFSTDLVIALVVALGGVAIYVWHTWDRVSAMDRWPE